MRGSVLSRDLLQEIALRVGPLQSMACARVCFAWKRAFTSNVVWRHFAQRMPYLRERLAVFGGALREGEWMLFYLRTFHPIGVEEFSEDMHVFRKVLYTVFSHYVPVVYIKYVLSDLYSYSHTSRIEILDTALNAQNKCKCETCKPKCHKILVGIWVYAQAFHLVISKHVYRIYKDAIYFHDTFQTPSDVVDYYNRIILSGQTPPLVTKE